MSELLSVNPMQQLFTQQNFAFSKLLAFRIQIVLAYQIMAVAVGWHIYEITHDTLSLGLVGLAEVIPYFACALFAGHAVDHYYSRRLFGVFAAAMLCLNALTLTLVTQGILTGNSSYWIYASIAFTGFARAFIAPSVNSLFAIILPRESFGSAIGISSSIFQSGLVLGPAVGGLTIGFAGKTAAYALATLLCFGAAITIWSIKVKEPKAQSDVPVFTSIKQGLDFVFSNQIMLGALSLDMFAVLFGGAVAMLPAFIQDIYKIGPEGLGILRAAPAVGAIATGLWLTRHPINRHAGRWLLCAVAGFGLSIIGFGLATSFWMAFALLLFSGVADGISVVMRQTIMQLVTPDGMRGRVSAINGIFIGSSNELGAFESGLSARLMGLVPSVIFGGLMTLSVVGATAKLAPKLRDLELHQIQ
ncbi:MULTISPECIES: MFS transporter [Methylotenera]|uniref:MFS transporter n=1 Tax=Methylotenera TaxID=359407 RepID=UPI001E517617|nr:MULTISPECIES: MFS transporter [Methylotenera]